MKRTSSTEWCWRAFGAFPLLLLLSFSGTFSMASGNSIMDIIDEERVEKLLAERRKNASWEAEENRRLMTKNSFEGDLPFSNNRDDNDYEYNSEGDSLEFGDVSQLDGFKKSKNWHPFRDCSNHHSNGRGHRIRPNLTGIPDVPSLLADFAGIRVDKILKSDKNSQLITRKEYLKKDWCKTEPIVQKIREDGCLTRTVLNRFCYGQCNSFYIPRNPPRKKRNRKKQGIKDEQEENHFFKSCGFCKPRKSSPVSVTLRCPGLVPPFRKKKIQRIKQCKCYSETLN